MIAVDYGSFKAKWFDGKNFGEGLPSSRFLLGLSSSRLFIKESSFPICRGKNLQKLIANEVSSELAIEPDEFSTAFCPVEREEGGGCRFLILVARKRDVEEFSRAVSVSADIVGTVAAVSKLLSGEKELTVIDAGASKVSLLNFKGGVLREVKLFRGKYSNSIPFLSSVKREKRVVLIGGGALDEEFISQIPFKVEILRFSPFGRLTPLYFNAFGLYHAKSSPCRAFFKSPSLFSSEFLEKNKRLVAFTGAALILSGLFITASTALRLYAAKRDYEITKRELLSALSSELGEKVVLPKEQVLQKLERLKRLREILKIDSPSILLYLKAVADSLPRSGILVAEVNGSASLDQMKIVGFSSREEALKEFISNLRKHFEKVNLSVSDGPKFKIEARGLKLGGGKNKGDS